MPEKPPTDTEARAFAGAEPMETPAGESPPLPEEEETETVIEMADGLADRLGVTRDPEPDNDDDDDEAEEDAPGSSEGEVPPSDTTQGVGDAEAATTAAEEALVTFEEAGIPSMDTDHELAAYGNGYRAGGDDPGYLLTLAELDRHLGSFFEPEEEEAFKALSREDFWSRWMLGYLDAAAGRMARPERPRTAEEMDW